MEDLKEIIRQFVIEEYVEDDSDIQYDTPLISAGVVDSFSMISLKRFLEKKYNIVIPDNRATVETFDTVDKIYALAKEYIG